MDDSAVYHRDMLDGSIAASWDATKPWIFETDEEINLFVTEEEACAAQREYRARHGFEEITGQPLVFA